MRGLIITTLLTLLLISSNPIAQGNEEQEPMLLARAEPHESTISKIANAHEKIKSNIENESRKNSDIDNGFSYSLDRRGSATLDLRDGPKDISLLIKNELRLERSLDLEYKSRTLKAEQLPLVISSKDKKNKGGGISTISIF